MNYLEQIDNYFTHRLTAEERSAFEQSLQTDAQLVDAVAFYLLTKKTAQTEARDARKTGWANLLQDQVAVRRIGIWTYASIAASVVVLLVLGWYFFRPQPTLNQVADRFITDTFQQLTVTMGAETDSLKQAVDLYNNGQLTQASAIFIELYRRDPTNNKALEYAGIVSMRQQNYDKAIDQFHRLSQRTDLFANPGTFYEALALLKRNRPGDEAKALQLLQVVIDEKLEGAKVAEEWIKN